TTSSRVVSVTAGATISMLFEPLVSDRNGFTVAGVVVAAMMCRLTMRQMPRARLAWLGAAIAVVALVLIGGTPTGAITLLISLVLGFVVALASPRTDELEVPFVAGGVIGGAVVLVPGALRVAAVI